MLKGRVWLFSMSVLGMSLLSGCGGAGTAQTHQAKTSVRVSNQIGNSNPTGVVPGTTNHVSLPEHVVLVIEENHSYQAIAHSKDAPYINWLMKHGANFTNYHAVAHPSEPNYLALFSGSTQSLTNDSCPHTYTAPNLASELLKHGDTFAGFSEGLPKTGYTGCSAREPGHLIALYARKHVPWVNFTNVPMSANKPLSAFPKNYNQLPTVSVVVPNLEHDMHNGTIRQGDDWLRQNLSGYAAWAQTHHSLLIVVWDEADGSRSNQVPAIIYGEGVRSGNDGGTFNHYGLLHTLEAIYGLPAIGHSSGAPEMTAVLRLK